MIKTQFLWLPKTLNNSETRVITFNDVIWKTEKVRDHIVSPKRNKTKSTTKAQDNFK